MRDAALGAIAVEKIPAGTAQPRLERVGFVVDAGMNDFAVARAGVHAELAFAFENEHLTAGARQRSGRRESDDPRADHDAIDVVQPSLPERLDRGRRG